MTHAPVAQRKCESLDGGVRARLRNAAVGPVAPAIIQVRWRSGRSIRPSDKRLLPARFGVVGQEASPCGSCPQITILAA